MSKVKFVKFKNPNGITALMMGVHFTPGKEYEADVYNGIDCKVGIGVWTNRGERYFIKDMDAHWGIWEVVGDL